MKRPKFYAIKGIDCESCAKMIELDLEDNGISAKCSYSKSELEVSTEHDSKKVIEIVSKAGYTVLTNNE